MKGLVIRDEGNAVSLVNLARIPFSVKKSGSSAGRFSNATLVRLSDFLSSGYKKGVRPVRDWRTSTTVAIDLMVYSILSVVGSAAAGARRL